MVELFTTFGVGGVIVILLIAIPAIINFLSWCKKLWATREKFKQDNINKGREIEARAEAKEERLQNGEARMTALEEAVLELKNIVQQQDKIIKRLERSDQLAIKTYIKEQHDIWMVKGFIDSQTLELLEQRFAIYKEEGGNSWAERLMRELRELPVAVIPADSHIED